MEDTEQADPKPRRARNLTGDELDMPPILPRRRQIRVILPLRRMLVIIGINAVLSVLISLAVVMLVGGYAGGPPSVLGTPAAALLAPPGQETTPVVAATQPPAAFADTPLLTTSVALPSPTPEGTVLTTLPPTQPMQAVAPPSPSPEVATPTTPPETPPGSPLPAEPVTYVVRQGDTLTGIAERFGVDLEALMRANNLSDPDRILVGQSLTIPQGEMPATTSPATALPLPTDTPLPVEPPTPLSPSQTALLPVPAVTIQPTPTPIPTLTPVPVSEVRLTLEVLNPGDPLKEMVVIINQGLYVKLTGWTLSNGRGNVYTFPEFSLGGGGSGINVHTISGVNTITDLYWGQPTPVWSVGDVATLKNSAGTVMATYTVK